MPTHERVQRESKGRVQGWIADLQREITPLERQLPLQKMTDGKTDWNAQTVEDLWGSEELKNQLCKLYVVRGYLLKVLQGIEEGTCRSKFTKSPSARDLGY